jgi:rfaE bifunctional protein nucleotidyltransferase chain/domain
MSEVEVHPPKVISPARAADWACALRHGGKRIVQAHGCFDLLHPGHLRYLEAAKAKGDWLVVSVTADRYVDKGPGRPLFAAELRAEMLAGMACVDAVVINDAPTAEPLIRAIRPHVYVKGEEYAHGGGEIEAERRAVESVGGTTVFEASGHTVKDADGVASSSRIINRHLRHDDARRLWLASARHRGWREGLPGLVQRAAGLSVLFIGEHIVDEYVYVSALGKPPKEFVIAGLKQQTESFEGGIVAAMRHAQSFVRKVDYLTDRTVTKTRFVDRAFNRKLFEVYEMNDSIPDPKSEAQSENLIRQLAPGYDVTVVVDFGHGMLTPRLRQAIMDASNFLAVNAQSNSANQGFNPITNYRADYLCCDMPEARLAVGDQHASAIDCIKHLHQYAPRVIVTAGHDGCYVSDGEPVHVPSFAEKVVDTMGAGDAFLAVSAPLAALSDDLEMVAFAGNIAGGLKVAEVGHRKSVDKTAFLKYADGLLQ